VLAYLNFTLSEDLREDAGIAALCSEVRQPSDQLIARWRDEWGNGVPSTFGGRDIVNRSDLGKLIYRVVGDTLVDLTAKGR
jgi:hypothetical protein